MEPRTEEINLNTKGTKDQRTRELVRSVYRVAGLSELSVEKIVLEPIPG